MDLFFDRLLPNTRSHIATFQNCAALPKWAQDSIQELIDQKNVDELNDRFFQTLSFGTGGMRNRTIAKYITQAERGDSTTPQPQHASIGTAYLNDFNIIGATIALYQYCLSYLSEHHAPCLTPSVVIAHDVRYFSRHFCELVASTWCKLGGHAMIFDGVRSTPQLSFSVRHLQCTAGVMITASHNPWHDNGFKSYFSDGAQMVDPHASGVIREFKKIPLETICQYCTIDLSPVTLLQPSVDEAYQTAVSETIIHPDIIRSFSPSVVYSPLHGTGAVAILPLLKHHNIPCSVVEQQLPQDPKFSTVSSPNPENHEAMSMAVQQAKDIHADIAIATDPDGDRLAVFAQNKEGQFEAFSGNITGAMLAQYRIKELLDSGRIAPDSSFAIIKTFVTTPLIEKIAQHYGAKCIQTLTGFKWIGEKMLDYEKTMLEKEKQSSGIAIDYDKTDSIAREKLLQNDSTFMVFGCEESYGCLAANNVRDKDANSACLMVCELAAYAKSQNKTLCDLRDEMYLEYGYFGEDVLNLYYEGADGAEKIKNILFSYQKNPPSTIGEATVTSFIDFKNQSILDADNKKIPAQLFFFITLDNGCKYAVRASGTEPKIKFYLFAEEPLPSLSALPAIKGNIQHRLDILKTCLQEDAHKRSS